MVIPSHSPCGAPKGKTETVKCAQSADFEKTIKRKEKRVPLFSLHQEQNVYCKHAFHLSRSGRNVMVWLIRLCTWYKQMQGHMHLWPCGCVLYWLWISDFDTCVCVCASVYVCVCVCMCDLGVAIWFLEIWTAYIKLQIIQVLLLLQLVVVIVIVIFSLHCPPQRRCSLNSV